MASPKRKYSGLSRIESKQVEAALARVDSNVQRLKDAISAYGTAQFEAGEWTHDDEEEWDTVYARAQEAEGRLIATIYDIFKVRL